MKKFYNMTFSICLILLCLFTFTGCNKAKTISISEDEYNQIIESTDKFFSNYSFTSFDGNGEKIFDARCVKAEDTLKMKMQIASRPDTIVYFFNNMIYVDESGEKDCFEYDLSLRPDINNYQDFARKMVYMQYVTTAISYGQEIDVNNENQEIEQTKEYDKIEKTTKGKEITLHTSGTQNIKQTNGSNITITNIKFEAKEVILDHARVKYCYSTDRNTRITANGEEIDSFDSKEKILVKSVKGNIELPNLEEFR